MRYQDNKQWQEDLKKYNAQKQQELEEKERQERESLKESENLRREHETEKREAKRIADKIKKQEEDELAFQEWLKTPKGRVYQANIEKQKLYNDKIARGMTPQKIQDQIDAHLLSIRARKQDSVTTSADPKKKFKWRI